MAAALATTALLACTLLNPLDVYEQGSDAGPSADAGAETGVDAEAGCALAHWPTRPATADQVDEADVTIALRTVSFEVFADAGRPPLGYDLDGVCTCPERPSCKAFAGTTDRCDLPLGRDNAGGQLLNDLAQFTDQLTVSRMNESLAAGAYGLLVRLHGYNGTQNDPQVSVAVYASNGTDDLSDASDAGNPAPTYDGNDRWTVDVDSLLGGATLVGTDCGATTSCAPVHADPNAYVADGMLVASVNVPLFLTTARIPIELSNGVVVAKLERDGATFRLSGQFLGRWRAGKLLTNLAGLQDPFSPGYLCDQNATYQNVKKMICAALDVIDDPALDHTDAPCNALSVGVEFTASAAKPGRVTPRPPPRQSCGGAWSDDCTK